MATQQIHKVFIFLKRKPDLSVEAFRRHYEEVHVPLCSKYFSGLAGYRRNFLDPLPSPAGEVELPFDVITELWYSDRATAERVAAAGASGQMPDDVNADEENFLDRSRTRYAVVTEAVTDLGS
jgi:uncharacterized protein (TIGR02118 family)